MRNYARHATRRRFDGVKNAARVSLREMRSIGKAIAHERAQRASKFRLFHFRERSLVTHLETDMADAELFSVPRSIAASSLQIGQAVSERSVSVVEQRI